MTAVGFLMIGAGLLLLTSGVKGTDPFNVLRDALGNNDSTAPKHQAPKAPPAPGSVTTGGGGGGSGSW